VVWIKLKNVSAFIVIIIFWNLNMRGVEKCGEWHPYPAIFYSLALKNFKIKYQS
jgi:hypothetical protein